MATEATHRWIEHTAEVELEIEAASAGGVLAEAMAALGELLPEAEGEPAERELAVDAPDLPALLAEWLEELVFLADTEGFVGWRVEAVEIDGSSLRARVSGVLAEPQSLVKAVTYHRLEMGPVDGGWAARVVLDV